MKKLLLTLSVIAGLLSNAFAIDLISVATNGKSSENSLGVKTLNNQEMSEIVGGAYISSTEKVAYQYGVKNNSGAKISYTAYYNLIEEVSNELLPLNVDDGSGKYKPVVQATLNYSTNKVNISIIGMNQYNPVYTRPADRNYANKLLSQYKSKIADVVNKRIRGDAGQYW
ncbi:hypothetical protein [Helicobacter pullorum]|uniref:hypothetical protein n=1 Tax=Helicobacter pullorum TaxID=35818 RepID=UPI00242AB15F|nr:hypothetical protein [Helicobacter pullorum]